MSVPCGGWLPLSEGVTYYEHEGPEDGPVVVLIHGFSVPSFVWNRTSPALAAAGWRVLRYDLYGRGASAKPLGRYDLRRFVTQLWELVDALHPGARVALVGYSMGGPIAAGAAGARPERVRGAAWIAPVVTGVAAGWTLYALAWPGLGPWLMRTVARPRMEQGVRADFHGPADEGYVQRYMAQWHDPGFARALAASVRAGMLGDHRAVFAALGRTGLPTAAVWGEADTLVPAEQLHTLRELIPNLAAQTVPDVGHLVHYERPDAVNPFLLKWLRPLQ